MNCTEFRETIKGTSSNCQFCNIFITLLNVTEIYIKSLGTFHSNGINSDMPFQVTVQLFAIRDFRNNGDLRNTKDEIFSLS